MTSQLQKALQAVSEAVDMRKMREKIREATGYPLIASIITNLFSMKFLTWNVRGAGKPFFHSMFRRNMQQYQYEMCVLMKTKLFGLSLTHN